MKISFLPWVISWIICPLIIGAQSTTVQPRILIIPYVASGQNALEEFENNFSYRTAIIEVSNSLNNRGFKPDDIQEIIAKIKENEAISTLKGVGFDPVERIIQYSSADIIIKAEVYIHTDYSGANSVQVNLRAIDKVSSKSMYAMNFDASPHFKTDDYSYLARRCLTEKNQINYFVEGLNASFEEVRINGRSISCILETNDQSKLNLSDEINEQNDYLSDVLINWVKLNAFNNNFRIRNNSEHQLYFDEIRIPWKDKGGQNFLPDDFAREFRKFIDQICTDHLNEKVRMPKPIVNNGTIRILIP
ncbi:MAG: hypothetical protein IPL31_00050 [Saprospiraceae bacterium]|nr:hypothetical protein [Saprospiraceae bacterium]